VGHCERIGSCFIVSTALSVIHLVPHGIWDAEPAGSILTCSGHVLGEMTEDGFPLWGPIAPWKVNIIRYLQQRLSDIIRRRRDVIRVDFSFVSQTPSVSSAPTALQVNHEGQKALFNSAKGTGGTESQTRTGSERYRFLLNRFPCLIVSHLNRSPPGAESHPSACGRLSVRKPRVGKARPFA